MLFIQPTPSGRFVYMICNPYFASIQILPLQTNLLQLLRKSLFLSFLQSFLLRYLFIHLQQALLLRLLSFTLLQHLLLHFIFPFNQILFLLSLPLFSYYLCFVHKLLSILFLLLKVILSLHLCFLLVFTLILI